MKIHVRRRHIESGMMRSSVECPIALAFMEATGKFGCGGGMSGAQRGEGEQWMTGAN